jgi:hypothetical protein
MNALRTLFRFVTTCCISRFQKLVFDEEFSEHLIEQGREILKHGNLSHNATFDHSFQERELRDRGLTFIKDKV